MLNKTIHITILLLVFHLFSYSQSDTLNSFLKRKISDSLKIEILNNRAWEIKDINPDIAFHLANKADSIAFVCGNNSLLASSKSIKALIFEAQGNFDKAIELHFSALSLAEKMNNKKAVAIAFNNIGNSFLKKNNFTKAIDYYKKSLEIKLSLPEDIANKLSIAVTYGNIGIAYEYLEEYGQSLTFQRKSLTIRNELKDTIGIGISLSNIGKQYYTLNNIEQASRYYNEALFFLREKGDKIHLAQLYKNIALIYQSKKDFENAIIYIDSSLATAKRIKAKKEILDALFVSAKIYTEKSDYRKSSELLMEYKLLNDILHRESNESLVAASESMYKNLKREQEIQNLLQENEFQKIKLSKNRILIYSGIGIIIALIFFIIINNRHRKLIQIKEKIELEQKLLRAQMNPHFLFNALNSIQSLILTDDKKLAYEYHVKFSKLMRMILMHSREDLITLKDEIDTLKLYMDIERLRTDNKFSYKIDSDANIDFESIKVPGLLIQPFVENSIWHGLMNKEEPGAIEIKVTGLPNAIKISIFDDGIGREKAEKIKAIKKESNKSVGVELTKKRIDNLSTKKVKSQVQISDILDINGNCAGTRVDIILPA